MNKVSSSLLKLLFFLFVLQMAPLYAEDATYSSSPKKSLITNGQNFLNSFLSNVNSDEILDADEAFQVELSSESEPDRLIVRWNVTEKYYLYRNKMGILVDDKPIDISLPPGKEKDDPLFGKVQVYYSPISTIIPRTKIQGKELKINFQGCAEIGVCYPPQQKTFQISELSKFLIPTANAATADAAQQNPQASLNTAEIQSETDIILSQLDNNSLWLTIALFFLAGLLLAFTPCVFPLVPILSGILSQQGDKLTTRKSLKLSSIYVLSMSVAYTIAGVVAGLLGKNLQAALQNPWLLSSFSLIFVLLALSMFGFYELQLPLKWQNKLNTLSNKKGSSSSIGVIIMGLLSALIVGPCIAPPLAGALLYIGQTGDAVTGGTSLFAMSLGMGTPLIIMGMFAGNILPKAGAWMESIKSVFGVLMLALAIHFLDRFIPISLSMFLWGALFIISAVYMGAFEPIISPVKEQEKTPRQGWKFFFKGIAWILMIIGIILLVGLASGGRSLLKPLGNIATNNANNIQQSNYGKFFQTANAGEDILNKLKQAKTAQKPAMFYVTADWCISCKELEVFTFSDERVSAELESQTAYKIDVTDNTAIDEKFMKSLNIVGPPAIIFIDRNGKEIKNYRVIGFMSADELLKRINAWKAG